MCKHGNFVAQKVINRPGGPLYSANIDSCLSDIIKKKQSDGIITVECCCGHGRWPGFIRYYDESIDIIQDGKLIKQFPPGSFDVYLKHIEKRSRYWVEDNTEEYGDLLASRWSLTMLPLFFMWNKFKDDNPKTRREFLCGK